MLDDEYISQREIEKELFDKFDKDSERSLSILKFVLVIISFYSVILFYMYNKLDIDLILRSSPYPPYSKYSIELCAITIFSSFFFSFKPLTVVRYKFVETKRSIRYREGPELEKNNRRVSINIRKQGYYNMFSIYLIFSSFLFFLGYFFGDPFFTGTLGLTSAMIIDFILSWIDIYSIEKYGREEL